MINAVVATLLFAISATCANRSARLVGGVEANFWRLILAALLLGMWAFALGTGLEGKAFPLFFVSGMVGIGVGDYGLFQAFPRLGARLTMLLTLCLTAPVGMLMEWIWMGQGLAPREIACVLLILAGVGVTLWPDARVPLPRAHLVAGVMFALLAALGGALGAVLSRRAYEICRLNQEMVDGPTAAFQRVLGGLIVTAMIFGLLRFHQSTHHGSAVAFPQKWERLLPWVVANALAGLTIGVSFMQRALETTQAGIVLAIIATTPIVVIPIARMTDGEGISGRALAGSVLAVAGAVVLALAHQGMQ